MTDQQSASSGRIFISYRRQDSAYPAGWLYDRLAERFGPEQIFKDVDSIELGDDFVEVITNAVGSCDVVLALIGKKWLRISDSGQRRLEDPNDFVRLEIEAAIERQVMLIPILVDGATMPRADQVPESIAAMVRRQALELSPNRFRTDTEQLLDVLERTLTDLKDDETASPTEVAAPAAPRVPEPEPDEAAAVPVAEPAATEPPKRNFSWSPRMIASAVAAVALPAIILALVLTRNAGSDDRPNAGSRSPSPTTSATAETPPKLGGAGAPIVMAHRGGDEEFAWQTLPAIEDAARRGAQLETDVRWTKDGVPVLLHDAGTTPGMECEGGNNIVADTDWPVLRDTCRSAAAASKDGKQYPIPTFAEAVSALAAIPGAEIYPEVKVPQDARQVRQFVSILKNVRMTDRSVVTSSMPDELAKIRAQAEDEGIDLRTMLFVSKKQVPAAELAAQDLWGVAVKKDIATKAYVTGLQDAGLKVAVWIVNTPAQWEAADQVGADLVLTDRPAEFGRWSEEN